MKKLLTFVLVAFLLVFTFQALPVPKSENQLAVTSTGQHEADKLAQPTVITYSEAERVTAKQNQPGKNKIFENSGNVNSHKSGFT